MKTQIAVLIISMISLTGCKEWEKERSERKFKVSREFLYEEECVNDHCNTKSNVVHRESYKR